MNLFKRLKKHNSNWNLKNFKQLYYLTKLETFINDLANNKKPKDLEILMKRREGRTYLLALAMIFTPYNKASFLTLSKSQFDNVFWLADEIIDTFSIPVTIEYNRVNSEIRLSLQSDDTYYKKCSLHSTYPIDSLIGLSPEIIFIDNYLYSDGRLVEEAESLNIPIIKTVTLNVSE